MDRTSKIVVALCVGFIILWYTVLLPKLQPPQVAQPTNAIPGQVKSSNSTPDLVSTPTNQTTAPLVSTNLPEDLLVVTNENSAYTFTSYGGGLKTVTLLKYNETHQAGRPKPATNQLATLNTAAPVPALTLLGDKALVGDGIYAVTRTATGVHAEKALPNGLVVSKDFTFGTNYLLTTKVRIENRTGTPVTVPPQEFVIGTATPMNEHDMGIAMGVHWYNGQKVETVQEAWFANRTLIFFSGTPRSDYLSPEGIATNVQWAAVNNQFFTMAVIPRDPTPQMVTRHVELLNAKAIHDAHQRGATNGFQTGFLYPAVILKENGVLERSYEAFFGPKENAALGAIAGQYHNKFDEIMGFGWFWFVSESLLYVLNFLHGFGLHYGLAIILITIVIKLIFWPLTAASTRSMKRMQSLQPQMKAIQDKYKDDPAKMQSKLMGFMKEHKISPLSGCWPMLVQIPIFMGFYRMLQSAIELRGVPFLWATDLAQPDTLFFIRWLDWLPFLGMPGVGLPLNVFPLIMAATMFWQTKLTPPAPGADPTQQKMMQFMPLMFSVMLYNMSSGLTLYWTVQNLLTIAQMKFTKNSTEVVVIPPAKAK